MTLVGSVVSVDLSSSFNNSIASICGCAFIAVLLFPKSQSLNDSGLCIFVPSYAVLRGGRLFVCACVCK